ncbi:MAG: iron-sulfur cluster assembly scaffold protein [Nanoarchaeota archaeon]|nr:iron-sulfur cluster assembly scaffold protein [Nanoarchaeota archaeon]
MTTNNHAEIPDDMYREHILELYKSPSNFGTLNKPDREATEHNSICGDEITIQISIRDGKIHDAKFSGSGCVISMVASSLLTDKLKGMNLEDVENLTQKDLMNLLKIKVTPARIKCALLPLEAAKRSLKK